MGNFSQKVDKFIDIFLNQNGYVKVVQGLHNTLLIAICGLIIGIVIGTLIATVRVIPKYKTLPRVLNHICSFYVALFRGTPMVVQLLIFYYVLLPIFGVKITGIVVHIFQRSCEAESSLSIRDRWKPEEQSDSVLEQV